MKDRDRFFPSIYRNLLTFGDDADPELHIKGNNDAIVKLRDMLNEAIEHGMCEDDIDGMYVFIEAKPNDVKLKPHKELYNPFEHGVSS